MGRYWCATIKVLEKIDQGKELKFPNFNSQRLALHQNGVEFCQQFNGSIRTSLTATYDEVRRCAMSPNKIFHRQARDTGTSSQISLTYKGVIGCASTEALRPSSHPMICSKIVNFDRTETSLTSKWGRILPAVHWCYQK